ncbi:MAG: tripartite tricarboxylate transporter permease, partial [Cyanobium sp. ELA712]
MSPAAPLIALGDSITAAGPWSEAFPGRSVLNAGISGNTTVDLLGRLDVLPGLGGPNGVAILLPLTFTMPPTSAIIMLSCIYWGTLFAGAITSVLFNIPGETHSVATTFDGYPLAQQGRAGEALTASFTGSFFGAFVAVLLITFLAPLVAKFALKFGPPEFFAVFLLTFCSFIGTGKDSFKTIISMMLGFGLGPLLIGLARQTAGWPAVFATAISGFALASLLVLPLRIPLLEHKIKTHVLHDIQTGFRAVKSEPLLAQLLIASILI